MNNDIKIARTKWLKANEEVSKMSGELFQIGSGYDPDFRMAEEHRLQSARYEANRLFQEYCDLNHNETEQKMLELQKSQRLATWASFVVAAAVGLATIANILISVLK